ncbi:hypothetical protein [Actinomadura litoris]|uniref:hypothetical protein n=1 Tax=Actinomadura litoris TaxID=2678616 RepID=UPI001FA77FBB|nr:hypothetical protein [Actinomadura litoris]
MNVRLIAGVAILTLIFGAWFAAFALDEGILVASVGTLGLAGLAAMIFAAVKLISDGMGRR